MNIHDIIDAMRSDPQGVAAKYGIPISTIYSWCNGSRTPPDYVLVMMSDIINLERMVKVYGNKLGSRMEESTGGIEEAGQESKSENVKT